MTNQNQTIEHLIHNMILERVSPVAAIVQDLLDNGTKQDFDSDAIKAEVLAHVLANMPKPKLIRLEFNFDGLKKTEDGCHPKAPEVLIALMQADPNDRNVYIWGGAGTGKTTLGMHVAKMLDVPLHMQGTAMSKYDLLGFRLPSGDVVETAFMRAWRDGGLIILDDNDRSDPKAMASLNAATANGTCDFSHCGLGLVPRHENCYIIATGNTPMNGQSTQYSAASKQDGAFRDRFTFVQLELDEAFELEVCPMPQWTKRVQVIRKAVRELGGKAEQSVLATMRASKQGASMLASGKISQAMVEEMVIFKGCARDVVELVYNKAGKPSTKMDGSLINAGE